MWTMKKKTRMKRILVRVRGPFPVQSPARALALVLALVLVLVQDVPPCLACFGLFHGLYSYRIRVECPVSAEVWRVWPVRPSV